MASTGGSVAKEVSEGSDRKHDGHQIFQTDDAITIVYSGDKSPASDKLGNFSSNDSNANGNVNTSKLNSPLSISEEDPNVKTDDDDFPKSILSSELARTYSTKKSVSFEEDETIAKFIQGEEIVDKKNPFRHMNNDQSEIYRNGYKKVVDEFISKEEILKQSKFVPVYIKNPDRVLTYDKTVLEKLNSKPPPLKVIKRPVPVPRKSLRKSKEVNKKSDIKYPDLSDIKVDN